MAWIMAGVLAFLIVYISAFYIIFETVKNVIVYILELLGLYGRTIDFIISILIIIIILFTLF